MNKLLEKILYTHSIIDVDADLDELLKEIDDTEEHGIFDNDELGYELFGDLEEDTEDTVED
jgi:hypothetical protein